MHGCKPTACISVACKHVLAVERLCNGHKAHMEVLARPHHATVNDDTQQSSQQERA